MSIHIQPQFCFADLVEPVKQIQESLEAAFKDPLQWPFSHIVTPPTGRAVQKKLIEPDVNIIIY